jgi:hypothetical protein
MEASMRAGNTSTDSCRISSHTLGYGGIVFVGKTVSQIGERSMLVEINHKRRTRRRFPAIAAITIAAARFA